MDGRLKRVKFKAATAREPGSDAAISAAPYAAGFASRDRGSSDRHDLESDNGILGPRINAARNLHL
jgi:hypothetical protein